MRLALLCATLLFGCTRGENLGSRIVVKVNDWSLSAEQLSDQLASQLKDLPPLSARDESLVNHTKNEIVQNFIVHSLSKDYASRNNIFVRQETLDAEVDSVRKQYPDDLSFRTTLAEAGSTYKDWQEATRITLLQKLIVTSLRKKLSAPDDAVLKDYYQKHRADFAVPARVKISQVLLETEDRAKMIHAELAKGKSIADLAKKYSIGAEASAGGDLGWIEKGASALFDNAFNMGVGQSGRVAKTAEGYLVYQLKGRQSSKTSSFEEAKPEILRIITAEKEQVLYSKWLETELLNARIFKDEDLIQAIKVHTRSVK